MGNSLSKMPLASSSPIFVLSLLLLLLGAVATQSEVSTPFFEEDAQLSVSPDNNQRLSPFDEAVQPKQNEETQAHAHPMPETIGVTPLLSWSSWFRTMFINALGLRGFDPTPMAPDSCQLKSGSPVGYKALCESAKDAAACAALSLTCAWGPPHPSPPTPACSGSVDSKNLAASECLAWQAFYDATGGGGCSRDDPCTCMNDGYHGVTCVDGHIENINLAHTGIRGSIPDSISALTGLYELKLFNTGISGSIPDSISALTALTDLQLDGTSISGSIPQSFCSLDVSDRCYLSFQGKPNYACPLPSCTDKLTACGITSCHQ